MDILMPQLGETVTEGKITTWFRAIGDAVKPGDNLFEIETDKVTMEVPATSAGVLSEIRTIAGATAPVGAIVAVIAGAAGEAPSQSAISAQIRPSPAAPKSVPISTPSPSPRQTPLDPFHEVRTPERNFGPARLPGGRVATPLARRLAGEAGIDIARVQGSGPQGRIIARDISEKPPASAPSSGPSAAQVMALYAPGSFVEVPLDAMRRTIATRLIQAKQTIPHFYLMRDVDIDRLLAMREEVNAASKQAVGALNLSINDFAIKAWALALQRVPEGNAVFAEDRILRFTSSDIGVAVAIEGGLLTPIIRQAETKSLSAISREMRDLSARARTRKLQPQEYQGGSSAISNLGMYGVREFAAIINPPHATILAIGAGQRRPVERDNALAFATQMSVTLSCDHRVVDGALGARLLEAFAGFIEQPVTMLA